MSSAYLQAVEIRLKWLRWLDAQYPSNPWSYVPRAAYAHFYNCVRHGDTYFMDRHFCELVDHARREVPSDLPFDQTWLQSRSGFVLLADPVLMPALDPASLPANERPDVPVEIRVAAFGWYPAGDGVEMLCFIDHGNDFGPWSYFGIKNSEPLLEKVIGFESSSKQSLASATYVDSATGDRRDHPLHEVRYVYTALYMMAQRLAITVEQKIDRATRRRAARNKENVSDFVRVVTLRRLEADRARDAPASDIDWQWRWSVRGHWRLQPYPSEGVSRWKFIEAYIKGPDDKPLKPDSVKVFVAKR